MDESVLEGSYVELLGARRVFAHDVMTIPGIERILDSVPDAYLYDRVVPVAREGDVVCLREDAEDAYLDWLEAAGLGTRNVCALPGPPKEAVSDRIVRVEAKGEIEKILRGRSEPAVFAPYFAGEPERKASGYLEIPMYSDTRLAWKFNSKIQFKSMCRTLGVPVLRSAVFCVDEGAEALAARVGDMLEETGVACIRGEHSSSASAMYFFPKVDEDLIRKVLRESDKGERYVVEPFCKVLSSPSSTWFITREKKIYHLRTSNQILERGVVHCGNEFPVTFDVSLTKDYSLKIARHYLEESFVGPFGFDFIETEKGLFATECNPRVTGAMYPWEIVHVLEKRHGRIAAARSQNLHLPEGNAGFSYLQGIWKDLLYDGRRKDGVLVPFNVGPLKGGKVTVVGTGASRDDVHELFEEAARRVEDSR